jgi:shikimate dehydrogenase
MEKNTSSAIYGVLGFPSKHSLSPVMHNAAFKELKINAEYRIFEVPPQELEGFLKGLSKNNIAGINVTIPYKERVIPYLQKTSVEADLIGAVNTIKVSQDGLEGFNTDGEGFLRHISEVFDFDPRDKKIAILGAGGASKAVCVYLAKTGPKRISVYDVNHEKVRGLIAHLVHCCKGPEFIEAGSIEELLIQEADLLVNATPIGMKESDPSLVDEKFLHNGLFVYDLIYHHPQTALLRSAREKGCLSSNGLGMLLYQGMLSFKIWTGKNAPKEVMEEALLSTLKKSHQV